ncbi:hypothetical protein PPACK8108_LOCUS13010 [Phakopsora pachyrhizi]|uniref:Uncharacterized protein n=1 Tax=Phakopsora pachyrhizi TaxID=170000 RepID=A0AAV0B5Y5_PHAPC|nr:hypothetical protein PPACK8108_LOCUS13010 [Phakopsora pachyrhizi]
MTDFKSWVILWNRDWHCAPHLSKFKEDKHTAWTSKAPGAVDPSKDTKDHKNHNREMMQELVQELASGQVTFSFFEREGLQDVLNKIAAGFDWPRRKKYAATAEDLYYEKK